MLPNRSLVILLIIPLVLAVMMLFDPSMLMPMLAVDAAIAAVALVDLLFAIKPLVQVSREIGPVFSLGRQNPVRLRIRNLSRRRLKIEVTEDLFEDAISAELPLKVRVAGRSREELVYHIEPRRRGAHTIGAHHVRYASPLGLWLRQLNLPAESRVKVYPDLQSIRTYELLARQDREFALVRATKLKGGESEFERLREYTRDDEYRALDWKATARRQRLIAREYQLESNQNLMFMLDAGRLMTAEADGIARFDHALNATLMLAHVATRGGDRVGLVGFDEAVRSFVPPESGSRAARRLIQASYDLHPRLVEPDYDAAFEYLALKVRKRSLVVMFSQVVDDAVAETLVKRTRGIARLHLPLLVLFRDAEVERLLGSQGGSDSLYVRGAAAEMLRWRDQLIRDLRASGALVLDTLPSKLTPALINHYLQIKARHLL
ncbi:MAG: DUF58 domain-containing protein [Polyangiaceae bacterium]|nr:DUF58 domain-containing protein [Polyangiaceae bacterium]MCB9608030.1 DUF58 domain-containing protein [Polyangiaceae bacterium]